MLECTQPDPLALPLVSGFFGFSFLQSLVDTKRFREGFSKQSSLPRIIIPSGSTVRAY